MAGIVIVDPAPAENVVQWSVVHVSTSNIEQARSHIGNAKDLFAWLNENVERMVRHQQSLVEDFAAAKGVNDDLQSQVDEQIAANRVLMRNLDVARGDGGRVGSGSGGGRIEEVDDLG